ncbi:MAG: hypothetical protein LKI93_02680 [Bifidobacteriaceae bacterium]|jgi:D-aspartate ligase|nr:hypothetical protein [Bifidobacteriaceae bacterium]MCI1914202.1 hypothetical protein [Bifidobacteriaceae bacterium]
MTKNLEIVPVLLGSGANAYGLARGFYEEFGARSYAIGPVTLLQSQNSKIIRPRVMPDLATEEGFVPALKAFAKELAHSEPGKTAIVIACGDTTAELLAHHRDEVAQDYLTSSVDGALLDRAVDKVEFSRICEQARVQTPLTRSYTFEDFEAGKPVPEPAAYPLELKAADSVAYLSVDFPGRKKAYTLHNHDELVQVVHDIYGAGYKQAIVIQEFIPGDDSQMRTLNAYVNSDGTVAMMSLGNPVMEEYAPSRIGNYAAIISEGDNTVYSETEQLLTSLHYTGYANFDLKRDPRDGTYKFLELNPRPGGSSDFTSVAGLSLARWIVRDLVMHTTAPTVRGFDRHLWLGVPKHVLRKFAPEGPVKDEALHLLKSGNWSKSAHYAPDMNVKRALNLFRWQLAVARDYYKYAPRQ